LGQQGVDDLLAARAELGNVIHHWQSAALPR
jgi:hypothetical protein